MGLTKQYLRYSESGKCNIVASSSCNLTLVTLKGIEGRYAAAGASEDVIVWDLKLSEKALVLSGEDYEVTSLCANHLNESLAVGYSDGTLKIYNLGTGENSSIFSGHKTSITCIKYSGEGHRIATGSKDTEIVVWDVVSECGLQRLSGHKGVVTRIEFFKDEDILLSSSKDSFIKFWDLVSGYCFKTVAGHLTEVWGLNLVRNGDFIIAGSMDAELRVWQITEKDADDPSCKTEPVFVDDANIKLPFRLECRKAGSVLRTGRGRVSSMVSDARGKILAVHGLDNVLELFEFLSADESKLKLRKRLRKEKKKLVESGETIGQSTDSTSPLLVDVVRRLPVIKVGGKIRSVDLAMGKGNELRVVVSLKNNSIELYSIVVKQQAEPVCLRKITGLGHRSEVRAVAFSSDNLAVVSASADSLKIWNRPTLASLRTVNTGYGLCVTFVPGDRHALVGTKEGNLQIIDVTTGDLLEDIPAHTSELWSIVLLPDQTGAVSGGGDATVKFWKLELVPDKTGDSKAKVLSLLHTRTLKVDEAVLAVRISPDSKFVAVALLDSTVKVFFLDTFKFFLSLYGHKLPVLCMDISYDSTLIATGSADRNIKIWGMDFGDCHKSIFAHDDSVTGLMFVPKTHYFFTCGKDGSVKQWDADNFEKITTLKGHHGEAWNIAVSPSGEYIASCGQDRVIRLYERTSEPLILEDEREQEREKEADATLASGPETSVPGHTDLKLSSRKTVSAEKAAELLIECLEVSEEYRATQIDAVKAGTSAPPVPAIMAAFNAKTPDEYLLQVLIRIRASELEEVLLFLPFTNVIKLLPLLMPLFKTPYADVICRVVVFLVRVHHRSITGNQTLLTVVQKLYAIATGTITEIQDRMGINLFGLTFLQKEMEEKEGVLFFADATQQRREKQKKKRKRERAVKRAILSL